MTLNPEPCMQTLSPDTRRARTARAQAFQDIEKKFVTENLFSQFCYKTLPNQSHLWLFKQQFCMQMALSGAAPPSQGLGCSAMNTDTRASVPLLCSSESLQTLRPYASSAVERRRRPSSVGAKP